MWKWILAAWTFVPGACWILACAIFPRRQRKVWRLNRPTGRRKMDFEPVHSDDKRLVFLGKSRSN